MDFIMDYFGVG